jgi:hypothetical protein
MLELQTIGISDLANVTGGADDGTFSAGAGANRFKAEGNIKGSGYGVTVEGQGRVETANNNYGVCASKAKTDEALERCAKLAVPGQ